MPLPHCLFTFFCLAGILLRNYYSFSPLPSTLSPPLSISVHIFLLLEAGLFGNSRWRGGVKIIPRSLFARFWYNCVHTCSCEGVQSRFSMNICAGKVCVCHPSILWGSTHTFHIWRALFVPNLCYRHCYHGYSPVRTTDTMIDTVAMATLWSLVGNMIIHGWGFWHITATWICSIAGKPACRW